MRDRIRTRDRTRREDLFAAWPTRQSHVLLSGVAVVGSANLSESSAKNLIEATFLMGQPSAVGMAAAFLDDAKELADVGDMAFLRRILKLNVIRSGRDMKTLGIRRQPRTRPGES